MHQVSAIPIQCLKVHKSELQKSHTTLYPIEKGMLPRDNLQNESK